MKNLFNFLFVSAFISSMLLSFRIYLLGRRLTNHIKSEHKELYLKLNSSPFWGEGMIDKQVMKKILHSSEYDLDNYIMETKEKIVKGQVYLRCLLGICFILAVLAALLVTGEN